MRNADAVLGVIRDRGTRGLPLEDIYRQLFNRDLYLCAYAKLYKNSGAMTPGATEEIVPARISKKRAEEARRYALAAHRRLRCWGMSRTDMIVAENGVWVLEVNTIPGMTSTSLLPRAAAAAGMSLGQLLDRLLELAFVRPEG